jgi:hypothetical protein
MLLLRKREAVNQQRLKAMMATVYDLSVRSAELAAEGQRLTRWDFLKMAIFGREPVIEAIKRRRIRENKPHVDMN